MLTISTLMSSQVSIKDLLEAGAHFGHHTHRWNPKMKEYIFGARNGIYIIDLSITHKLIQNACDFAKQIAASGGNILFVGTKRQAQEVTKEEATRCGMFYTTFRWLGGTLTNFATIKSGIQRLQELEDMKEKGIFEALSKKEVSRLEKERTKLMRVFEGIRTMKKLPDALFVVDPRQENIAVAEANKLSIPVIAVVDTNTNPDGIDYIIPGNDDAIKAIRLYVGAVASAIVEGRATYLEKVEAQAREQDSKAEEKKRARSNKENDVEVQEKLAGSTHQG